MMNGIDLDELIAAWLDGRISQGESETLQRHLLESCDARARFRELSALDAELRGIVVSDSNDVPSADSFAVAFGGSPTLSLPNETKLVAWGWVQWATAATVLAFVGSAAYLLGKSDSGDDVQPGPAVVVNSTLEKTIAGYALLRRVAGIQWANDRGAYREGDVLSSGMLELNEGVVEIDFFCGATVVVEGPAKIDVKSDWSMRLLSGRLRANVPPAARGFVIEAADSEIIDLGTEFALEVSVENTRVSVIDGEIEIRGGQHDGDHLITGESQTLVGVDSEHSAVKAFSTIGDLHRRRDAEQGQRFSEWKEHSQALRRDKRLIAYFPIAESQVDRVVLNSVSDQSHAHLVGPVDTTQGRFGSESAGLEFDRLGARARTQIEGKFSAFTFCIWVKIDSLEHKYNALFMGDGYENGEPHWQIRDDGCLMFSVMVDDTPGAGEGKMPDARLHRLYFTEPFWDLSKSGQWFHIAAVYDPDKRQVTQYVNGRQLSQEPIPGKYRITDLRIGAAEIGNWGQPLRKSPWFAVRNLNGTIDELAIFDAALDENEISSLYQQGKPLGY